MPSLAVRIVLLMLSLALVLGACAPAGAGEAIVLAPGERPPTGVTVTTYGDGGTGIMGAMLALRRDAAQTVEVIYATGPVTTTDGVVNDQFLIVRYSQEPPPAE